MRILLLANSDIGLYRFRKELVSRLAGEHELVLSLPPGRFTQAFRDMGCQVVDTRLDLRGLNPFKDFALAVRYLRLIWRIKPQAVLTYTIKPNVYGGLACRLLGVPQLANITGLGTSIESGGPLRKLVLAMYRFSLKKARRVFFQNAHNRDLMLGSGVITAPSRLIPGSGVNLQENPLEPYPDDKQGVQFLFIGRIMKSKGINELLEAFKKVRETNASAVLTLVGEPVGDHAGSLKALDGEGQIRYLGYRGDIHDLITACHCVVLPSYHEGMANVLLEAAAAGRPVIASGIPGCREAFDEGESGLSCVPGDSGSLLRAMNAFIGLPWQDKRDMGLHGRAKMEREFDRERIIRAYLDEIASIQGEMKQNEPSL